MTSYYAYYNETGQVTSISNVPRTEGPMLVLTEEVAMPFLLGKRSRHHYQVTAVTSEGKTSMELVRIEEATTVPKVIVFGPVSKFTTAYQVAVEFNLPEKKWIVSIVDDNELLFVDNTLVLFVVKETNYDEIVRAIQINADELTASKRLEFSFLSEAEEDINNLTILTKLVPDSYKLIIKND